MGSGLADNESEWKVGIDVAIYTGSDGTPIELGAILNSGGEGYIHDVAAMPDFVAKIWREPDESKARKLDVLLRNPPDVPYEATGRFELAWPSEALRDEHNVTQGYLMPKVPLDQYQELVRYCIPATRMILEQARGTPLSWAELATIARNVAEAFGHLHKMDYLIGDVNHTNILVRNEGKVFFIDLDSIQATDPKSDEIHRCTVGKDDFTPPRLVGQRFEVIDRIPDDDLFGLAVLIFEILMNGNHPYDPIDQTGAQGQVRQDNIRRSYSPYVNLDLRQARAILDLDMIADAEVRERTRANMLALIDLEATADFNTILGPRISAWLELESDFQQLFRRAFGDYPEGRPTANEWTQILEIAGAAILRPTTANPSQQIVSAPVVPPHLNPHAVQIALPSVQTLPASQPAAASPTTPRASGQIYRSRAGRAQTAAAYQGQLGPGNYSRLLLWVLGIGGILALVGFVLTEQWDSSPEPTRIPAIIVVGTNTPTSTSTYTPIPTQMTTSTPTLPPTRTPLPTVTATRTPVPTYTSMPTFTPSPTATPRPSATATSTYTPSITPTATPTAFVCGYVEKVLAGAGKKHKYCHTATPTNQ